MPKVVCLFGGTGCPTRAMVEFEEGVVFSEDTVRLYFSGCQDRRIGGRGIDGYVVPHLDVVSGWIGGILAPNLDYGVGKLRRCFTEDKKLSLKKLKEVFGSAVRIEGSSEESIDVEELDLFGMSRGGVTTFAAARALDDLEIPMHLQAIDPVPGNSILYSTMPTSEYHKNFDLRGCKHLRSAEVEIGAYRADFGHIHNTYFRQMVPLFGESCAQSIYLSPRPDHFFFGSKRKHHFDFLKKQGLATDFPGNYEHDGLFYPPKIAWQGFHAGVGSRYRMHPEYKEAILDYASDYSNALIRSCDSISGELPEMTSDRRRQLLKDAPIKKLQAFYHLHTVSPKLWEKLKGDDSNQGIALREFVVELKNITLLCQATYGNEHQNAIQSMLHEFYTEIIAAIEEYPVLTATQQQKEALYHDLLTRLSVLEGVIAGMDDKKQRAAFLATYKQLAALMSLFLEENILFHPELAEFIDETETAQSEPLMVRDDPEELIPITEVSNLLTANKKLFHLKGSAREDAAVDAIVLIPRLVTTAKELAELLRFLPARHIPLAMRYKPELVTSYSDVNQMMALLFSQEQKNVLFNCLESRIKLMKPNSKELATLISHFPAGKTPSLLTTTIASEEEIGETSTAKASATLGVQLKEALRTIKGAPEINTNILAEDDPTPAPGESEDIMPVPKTSEAKFLVKGAPESRTTPLKEALRTITGASEINTNILAEDDPSLSSS